jgi:hypothetical protein
MSDRSRANIDDEANAKAVLEQQPPGQRHPQRDVNTDDIHTPSINEPPGSKTQPWTMGEGLPPDSNTKEFREPLPKQMEERSQTKA